MKELLMEKQKLDNLKAEVNNMEYDALQRRFRRVNSTSLIPTVRSSKTCRVLDLPPELCSPQQRSHMSVATGYGPSNCLVSTRVFTLAAARRDDAVAERKPAAADRHRLYVEGDGSAALQRYARSHTSVPPPTPHPPSHQPKCE